MAREATETDMGMCDWTHTLAFVAKSDTDDNPNFYQALNGPGANGFRQAMDRDIDQLLEKRTWDMVDRSVPLILGANIVGTTWAFKCKRYPD